MKLQLTRAARMSSSSSMNRWWIPNTDIHKRVITQELPYYLGPEATVRPYTREVRSRRCDAPLKPSAS